MRHLLERFTAKMLEKNIRGYERQFYIQRLVAAMLAVAENAGLSVNQVLADRQANLFETISKIYTADQMQNFLMDEVAVPVMDLLTGVPPEQLQRAGQECAGADQADARRHYAGTSAPTG